MLAALLLSGCGDSGPQGDAESANLVRPAPTGAASQPRRLQPDGPPPQLEPLGSDEIEAAALEGAGCDFTIGEQVLLVAVEREAIVRVGGRILRLSHYGPLGNTGGFFAGREVRVSVGRTEGARARESDGPSWPARIAVTSPTSGQPSRIEGRWSCGV